MVQPRAGNKAPDINNAIFESVGWIIGFLRVRSMWITFDLENKTKIQFGSLSFQDQQQAGFQITSNFIFPIY